MGVEQMSFSLPFSRPGLPLEIGSSSVLYNKWLQRNQNTNFPSIDPFVMRHLSGIISSILWFSEHANDAIEFMKYVTYTKQ